ncbi:uncharacterized protein EDB93DRAFT_1248743 [Suillus bovinus]|uniref:uncharacterized protein n=1 Tax=Suillus bovinus TaxID=48563 RepID=UPI001B861CCE|nr:uncharacterized protein EDB93DRAFT_1248743 [Suillus bovinus]KAG2153479.1 hypothetical protein EDB93DRAFT_1248743 [Suillus bovinus]
MSNDEHGAPPVDELPTSEGLGSKRRIAHLEEKLLALESGRAAKESLEDLVAENDWRYDVEEDAENTTDQNRLQIGYMMFTNTMWWFKKAMEMEYEELLCPSELDWNNPIVKAGIRDRADGYIVTDLSFLAFFYAKYTAKPDDLEEGLFKGKILIQAYKAVFMSPSSAKDVDGNGNGIDIIQNNRCARKSFDGLKVKKHVVQIINMVKVTPQSIAYIVCQVQFALSSITSWQSVDGDFDYVQFWQTVVDFFKRPPS